MTLKPLLAAAAASLLLAACGGGSSDTADQATAPPMTDEVPDSATSSITSFAEYVGSLPPTETGTPKDVSRVVPPTSESQLPITVL